MRINKMRACNRVSDCNYDKREWLSPLRTVAGRPDRVFACGHARYLLADTFAATKLINKNTFARVQYSAGKSTGVGGIQFGRRCTFGTAGIVNAARV